MEWCRFTGCNLLWDVWMSLHCGSVELRTQDVANRIALEPTPMIPENQCTSCKQPSRSVWRDDSDIRVHSSTPRFWQIFGAKSTLKHLQLQFKTQHDVEVIGNLVRFGSD